MGYETSGAPPIAFQINSGDNVATLLSSMSPGPVTVRGTDGTRQIIASEAIEHGHKIAITSIEKGENIVKFGVVIGAATCAIREGEWVHLHNCKSKLDARSNAFDVLTGVPEDVRYE